MKSVRLIALLLCLMQILSLGAIADVIEQKYEHKLGMSEGATSWEHRIDLPENLAAQGHVFNKRMLAPEGRLVVEREELTKTYYYIKVRLPKAQLLPMKGAVKVTIETTQTPTPAPVPPAPEKLYMTEPAEAAGFGWEGMGKYTNITLLDRGTGQTIWERVAVNSKHLHLDEDKLYVNHRYIWAVVQSDESGVYGPASQFKFRIGTRVEICKNCNGSGWRTCTTCGGSGHIIVSGPNGQPMQQICSWCQGQGRIRCQTCMGTGHVTVPAIYPDN